MTLVYAHRGASGNAPENTIDAFLLAIAQGSDGIEIDVHLSKDQVPVVMHDETLDRTSNGKGFIKDFTFEELRKLDCNNHMLMPKRCKIPSLQEVVSLCKKNNILLNIELKTDTIEYPNIERIVYEVVKKYQYKNGVIYSSFNPNSLTTIKSIDANAFCGFLYYPKNDDMIDVVKVMNFDGVHPNYKDIDQEYVKRCKQENLVVNCWTVNSSEAIEACLKLDVDGIITNYPSKALEIRR